MMILLHFAVLAVIGTICLGNVAAIAKTCGSSERVDVFWINLEKSVERRKYMEQHLIHYGYDPTYRIRAVTAKDVTVPQEVSIAKDCSWAYNHTIQYVTSSAIFNSGRTASSKSPQINNINANAPVSNTRNVNRSVFKDVYKLLMTALCGRPRNSRRELVVTISHLMAIRAAVYSNTPSRYALILEDDVKIPIDIDFVKMARQAPDNFGVLQLVTSNDYDVAHLWKIYTKNPSPSSIWKLRVEEDHWCAGAYLINKAVMKPYIDAILQELSNGWIGLSVIAAYTEPCFPSKCCRGGKFVHLQNGCVKAPRGYQSDHFVFSIAQGQTYMITVPLITSASLGNSSTLHQDHVTMHHGAFNRINNCINDMKTGKVPFPSFVNRNCTY